MLSAGTGFPDGAPADRIVYSYDDRLPLRDFESWHEWVVSAAAKRIIEQLASTEVDFEAAEVAIRRDGIDYPAGDRWVCDVTRYQDAIDEEKSTLSWIPNARYYADTGSKFTFRDTIPDGLHLFRPLNAPQIVVCSDQFRVAVSDAQLSGIKFSAL